MDLLNGLVATLRNMRMLWGFFALSAFYLIVLLGAAALADRLHKNRPPGSSTVARLTKSRTGRAQLLLLMTAATLVVACFNFGPPVFDQESQTVKRFLARLWFGDTSVAALHPSPRSQYPFGWFWWKAFGIYLLASTGYIGVACTTELAAATKDSLARYEAERAKRSS